VDDLTAPWWRQASETDLMEHIGQGPRFLGGAGSIAEAEVVARLIRAMEKNTTQAEASSRVLIRLTWVLVALTAVLVALTLVLL
jgi:hypothetical protein